MISQAENTMSAANQMLARGDTFKENGREFVVVSIEANGTPVHAEMVRAIDPGLIDAHPKNRTRCEPEAQTELEESICEHGQSTPGIVRPHPEMPGRYQLIAGWRRRNACAKLGRPLEVMVREMDDAQALEQLYLENAARENLRPLDEAELVAAMLDLRDAEGTRIFTMERIAKARYGSAKPGDVARVEKMHKLRVLPEILREPVNAGTVGLGVAFLVARIADAADREAAAQDVLNDPQVFGEQRPMTQRRAAEWIAQRYQVNLKGWEHLGTLGLLNAEQMAEMGFCGAAGEAGDGSCLNCPFLAKNNPLFEGAVASRGKKDGGGETGVDPMTCPRASCHRNKLESLWQRAAVLFAEANGLQAEAVLSLAQAKQEAFCYIALDDKPTGWNLNNHDREVLAKVPTWEKILKGSGAPLHVLPDDKGKPRLMCEQAVAIQAGAAKFPELFKGRVEQESEMDEEQLVDLRAKREGGDELTADEVARLAELEQAEEEYRVSRLKENMQAAVNEESRTDSLRELLEKMTEKGPGLEGARVMVRAVCRALDFDFLAFLMCKPEEELPEEYADFEDGLKDYLKGSTVAQMIAVAAVAAVWEDVMYSGHAVAEDFQALCAAVGVDTRAIHARVKKAHELAFKESERARKAALKADAGVKVKRKNSVDPVNVSADKEAEKTAAADATYEVPKQEPEPETEPEPVKEDAARELVDLSQVDVEAAGAALKAGTVTMADCIGVKPHKQKEAERFKQWDALRAKILRKAGLKK